MSGENEDINNIPEFVITLVAEIVTKMKCTNQVTLTQMLGYPDSEKETDSDKDIVPPNPKKQKTTKSHHSKNSVNKKKSLFLKSVI